MAPTSLGGNRFLAVTLLVLSLAGWWWSTRNPVLTTNANQTGTEADATRTENHVASDAVGRECLNETTVTSDIIRTTPVQTPDLEVEARAKSNPRSTIKKGVAATAGVLGGAALLVGKKIGLPSLVGGKTQNVDGPMTTKVGLAAAGVAAVVGASKLVNRYKPWSSRKQWADKFTANPTMGLNDLPEYLREDREVVSLAITRTWVNLRWASEKLKNDRELVLAAVRQNGNALQFVSNELRSDDKPIILLAVEKGYPVSFLFEANSGCPQISTRLRDDEELITLCTRKNGDVLRHASRRLSERRDLVLLAVKSSRLAFRDAPPEIQYDREILLAAVEVDWTAIFMRSMTSSSRITPLHDRELLLAMVSQHYIALKPLLFARVPRQRILESGRTYLINIGERGSPDWIYLLHYVDYSREAESMDIREIVLAAAKQNWRTLELLQDPVIGVPTLLDDREIISVSMVQDLRAIGYASERLRGDRELIQQLCNHWKERIPDLAVFFQKRKITVPVSAISIP